MKKIFLLLCIVTFTASFIYGGGQKEEMAAEPISSEPMITGAYVPGQTETAYAYVHGGYVGMAKVKTDANGDLSVELDEAFLPHILAQVDMDAAEWTEENTVVFESHGPKHVAKYVEYNGKQYIGVSVGSSISYVEADEAGMAAGNIDLEMSIIRNQGTMESYYTLVASGSFKIFTAFGGDAITVTTTGYGGLTKKNSPGYWAFGQTWIGNIRAIEDFIAANGVQFNESDMMRAKEENADGLKLWSVADAVSGATNSDFRDYFGLSQHAAGKLKTN